MILKVIKHFVQEPYTNQEVGRKIKAAIEDYDELLTPVVTSCLLPWTAQTFQNGVYSQSQEADLYLEGNDI